MYGVEMESIKEAILRFRKENKLSQSDIAKKLVISQAHVSRLEKGATEINPRLLAKIQKLIKTPIASHDFELSTVIEDSLWRIAYFYYPNKYCGDRVWINSKQNPDRILMLHCDAVGSDVTAAKDADLLIASFEGALSALSLVGVSVEAIYSALNKSVKITAKDLWRGDPSANIVSLHKTSGKLEYLCAGMPSPLLYKKSSKTVKRLDEIGKVPPIGQASTKDFPTSRVCYIERDDVFFFASDGFEELYKNSNLQNVPFETFFSTIAGIHRGDVGSIGSKILKTLKEQTYNMQVKDDISFLIASVNK